MKFSVATVVAFAAAVFARPEFTNTAFNVVEGQPFTLTWRNSKGSVTIELLNGPDKDSLNPVRTLTTLPDGTTSFTFTPSGLPSGNYAFRISDESGEPPNYTVLIPYTGTGTLSSTTGATRTSTRISTSISTSISSTETETETETTTDTVAKTTSTRTASSTGSASITTTLSTTTPSTSTSTTTSASRSTSSTGPANTNNGQRFASSLALVLGTVAALVFFN